MMDANLLRYRQQFVRANTIRSIVRSYLGSRESHSLVFHQGLEVCQAFHNMRGTKAMRYLATLKS